MGGGKKDIAKDSIFFRDPEARREVFEFSKAIAEYLEKEGIKDLVIVDRSSRPLYIGVREYWDKKFRGKQRPGIYFINPKGFESRDVLSLEEADINKKYSYETVGQVREKEEIIAEFERVYPKLVADKNKPILIFDTCIHSGDTLVKVVEIFKEMGFSDVRIGAVNPADRLSKVKKDFFITTSRPERGCYPFDRDRMIEKTFEHIYSRRVTDTRKIAAGVEIRREIKKIMEENLESDR